MTCWLSIAAGYVLSVAYGLAYSYPYARDIYVMGFGERIYTHARWLALALVLAALSRVIFSRSSTTEAPARSVRF